MATPRAGQSQQPNVVHTNRYAPVKEADKEEKEGVTMTSAEAAPVAGRGLEVEGVAGQVTGARSKATAWKVTRIKIPTRSRRDAIAPHGILVFALLPQPESPAELR